MIANRKIVITTIKARIVFSCVKFYCSEDWHLRSVGRRANVCGLKVQAVGVSCRFKGFGA